MEFWHQVRHFFPKEFDDPDYPDSHTYMDPMTILLLDRIRQRTGWPGWPVITHNRYGIHGCVCMEPGHHSTKSFHNYDNPEGCSAVDFHFKTDADPRDQARVVFQSGFTGIGIYQDCWKWPEFPAKGVNGDKVLPIGFHADRRKHYQIWKLENGKYVYLLR